MSQEKFERKLWSVPCFLTAEGVENEQMLNFLRSWNCDQAQGFYFSQALSAEEFETYLMESESQSISA